MASTLHDASVNDASVKRNTDFFEIIVLSFFVEWIVNMSTIITGMFAMFSDVLKAKISIYFRLQILYINSIASKPKYTHACVVLY